MIERKSFGKLKAVIDPPNLIGLQTESFREFLQADVPAAQRDDTKGLQSIFKEFFPIEGGDGKYVLDFVKYEVEKPKTSITKALADGGTYAAPLRATFSLKEGAKITQEEVFLGDIPLMTPDGAFVYNGAERVIVSQLHRSPGVTSEIEVHPNGQKLHAVRIIPDRGNWAEFQFDTNDVIWVYLDRRRRKQKFCATSFLRALGYDTDEQVLGIYYKFFRVYLDGSKHKKTEDGFATLDASAIDDETMKFLHFKEDVKQEDSDYALAHRYEAVSAALFEQMAEAGLKYVDVVDVSYDEGVFLKTLLADSGTTSTETALINIYRSSHPSDPPTLSQARQSFENGFFSRRHYDLGLVGRYKLNMKLGLEGKVPSDLRTLHQSGIDIVEAIRLLLDIKTGRKQIDDIDHLGNRRVRTVGELLLNQCRIGLSRMDRLIRDRFSMISNSSEKVTPTRLVNSKTLSSVVNDFFGRSQLSQFMDQTNPLSGLAHKRRLSALGPGGLSRDRAGFEVRDVHTSHYGRICPIETPEGPNIGLISSLGLYANINKLGFIEAPYRRVVKGKATGEVVFMSADDEEKYVIAQANAPLDANNRFVNDIVAARKGGEFVQVPASTVEFMDVSPLQVISIAAGLIPFLEHDDANRALMGANMMRQAVPLLRPDRAYVATGLEGRAAADSKVTILSETEGVVAYVDAMQIVVTPDGKKPRKAKKLPPDVRVYDLQKFRRTNAGTCFNQKPLVKVGQKVEVGTVLADGPASKDGELALGKNLTCAYMPWNGYNFEDAILISERVVRDDVFTSVHIQDYEVQARTTKLGDEEITRDIPNVGEDALKNLAPNGVIRVGAEVRPGDILVGKVTPKSETELTPEERLLRAIFGEKAAEVRDTSLKVPSGVYGVVMDVKVMSHSDVSKAGGISVRAVATSIEADGEPVDAVEDNSDQTVNMDSPDETSGDIKGDSIGIIDGSEADADHRKQIEEIEKELTDALAAEFLGEKFQYDVIDAENGDIIIPAKKKINKALLAKLSAAYNHYQIETSPLQEKIDSIVAPFRQRFEDVSSNELPMLDAFGGSEAGNKIKHVRVFIAEKKNLSVGDKLAGRHGNKGVVSRIVKDCDMPYLPDGTPVDIVLNPLGVPSRMNLGQLFEAYLGAACKQLGFHAATPVFDGAQEQQIDALLAEARESQVKSGTVPYINVDGKSVVYDGRTGEPFKQRVVIGQTYFLKLHHLVTDKIHARATGPYSLVTQQPLGGKAQYGGQRMGEMEVWALEAFGVAFALQELLTVKSDDTVGRTRIYESIVKGTNSLESGMPESFSVLMNELRGLCLDMKLISDEDDEKKPASTESIL